LSDGLTDDTEIQYSQRIVILLKNSTSVHDLSSFNSRAILAPITVTLIIIYTRWRH